MSGVSGRKPVWATDGAAAQGRVMRAAALERPSVSVVVPVYNMAGSGYLDQVISSLRAQSLPAIEFILVDDCSTDDSLSSMLDATAGDGRFAVVASERNGRQGAARNIGIDCARGRYLGFVDADDAVDPGYFQALYEAAEKAGADIAIAPFVTVDENLGNPSELYWAIDRAHLGAVDAVSRAYLIAHPAHVVCSLYRADLFASGVRFPTGVYFEDNPTCLRLLCDARSVALIPDGPDAPKYYYRQHARSTDHRTDNLDVQIQDRLTTSDYMLADARRNGYYDENRDALNLYYLKLCLLNSLSKLAAAGKGSYDAGEPRRICDHARGAVGPLGANAEYRRLSLSARLKIQMALAAPRAYVALLRMLMKEAS